MAYSQYTSILQHNIRVFPQYGPSVNPNKSARQNDGVNEQNRWIPRGLPDAYPSKYRQRTNKRSTDRYALIDQWECSVCGVEPWNRQTQTPRPDNDG